MLKWTWATFFLGFIQTSAAFSLCFHPDPCRTVNILNLGVFSMSTWIISITKKRKSSKTQNWTLQKPWIKCILTSFYKHKMLSLSDGLLLKGCFYSTMSKIRTFYVFTSDHTSKLLSPNSFCPIFIYKHINLLTFLLITLYCRVHFLFYLPVFWTEKTRHYLEKCKQSELRFLLYYHCCIIV